MSSRKQTDTLPWNLPDVNMVSYPSTTKIQIQSLIVTDSAELWTTNPLSSTILPIEAFSTDVAMVSCFLSRFDDVSGRRAVLRLELYWELHGPNALHEHMKYLTWQAITKTSIVQETHGQNFALHRSHHPSPSYQTDVRIPSLVSLAQATYQEPDHLHNKPSLYNNSLYDVLCFYRHSSHSWPCICF